jgi:hypothetical protein
MLRNEGGPVAARTIFPVLEQNWTDLGFTVTIVLSDVMIRSIENALNIKPTRIPEARPAGGFKEASVTITAENFYLQCHTEAKVGHLLGTVTMHNYLRRDFKIWFTPIHTPVQALDKRFAKAGHMPQTDDLLEALRVVVASAETQSATSEKLFESLAVLGMILTT